MLPYSTGGILTGMIIGLSRAIGETAPIITIGALTFIAVPAHVARSIGSFPFVSFDWLKRSVHGHADPDVQLGVAPRSGLPGECRGRRCDPAGMTLMMNGVAIYIRYRFRKKINW